jgi:hypothetical protein
MREPVDKKPDRGHMFSPLRVLLGVLIGITILACLIVWPSPPRRSARRVVCLVNLKTLGVALSIYAEEHDGSYPPADKWCDLLVRLISPNRSEEAFRCPKAGQERCDYAMNPRADARSAPDVVLLFESTGGWNQSGGPELLTTKHHEGKGCNVLFVGGWANFVKTEDIPHLKWEGTKQEGTWPLVPSMTHP